MISYSLNIYSTSPGLCKAYKALVRTRAVGCEVFVVRVCVLMWQLALNTKTSLIRLLRSIEWYHNVSFLDIFGFGIVLLLDCLHQLVQLTNLLI